MVYLLADVYLAFNPGCEMRSKALAFNGGNIYNKDHLTSEELIIHGCTIRRRLESVISDNSYRILRLYFKEPSKSIEDSLFDLAVIRPYIIAQAKIFSRLDPMFVDLCCLTECWQTDLFRSKKYGPIERYGNPIRSIDVLHRRKRKIKDVLQLMRIASLEEADSILRGEECL